MNAIASAPDAGADTDAGTLGQLVGRFAHDLCNHLAMTLSTVELAARADDAERARQLLSRAVDAIQSQRLLLDAMGGAAVAVARPHVCDVHEMLRARLQGRPERLAIDYGAGDAHVLSDPGFLARALEHILDFAEQAGATRLATSNGAATRHRHDDDCVVISAAPIAAPDESVRAFKLFAAGDAGGSLRLAQIHDTARRAFGHASFDDAPDGSCILRVALRRAERIR